jgi:hypothetical protein
MDPGDLAGGHRQRQGGDRPAAGGDERARCPVDLGRLQVEVSRTAAPGSSITPYRRRANRAPIR